MFKFADKTYLPTIHSSTTIQPISRDPSKDRNPLDNAMTKDGSNKHKIKQKEGKIYIRPLAGIV